MLLVGREGAAIGGRRGTHSPSLRQGNGCGQWRPGLTVGSPCPWPSERTLPKVEGRVGEAGSVGRDPGERPALGEATVVAVAGACHKH